MSELRALMEQDGISYPEARILREALQKDGRTIEDYLQIDAVNRLSGSNEGLNPLALFRAAGDLVKMAGSKEKAVEALESFVRLSQPVS